MIDSTVIARVPEDAQFWNWILKLKCSQGRVE
jgi:hypothetical protein